MAGYTLGQMWRLTKPQVGTKRDRLVRRGHRVIYNVWGNPVAILDTKRKTLSTSDAGWKTNLTKNRLNQILPEGKVRQKNYDWYYQTAKGKNIPFKGGMKFNLKKLGY